jgi:hypothetical protein
MKGFDSSRKILDRFGAIGGDGASAPLPRRRRLPRLVGRVSLWESNGVSLTVAVSWMTRRAYETAFKPGTFHNPNVIDVGPFVIVVEVQLGAEAFYAKGGAR